MTFDTLYQEHYERLFRFACRMLGSAEEARDVVQETFVKLHRALGDRVEIRCPKTWLYTVTANSCKNGLKRQALFRDVIRNQIEPDQAPVNIESELIRNERMRMIKQAIAGLSDRDRTLLMLYQDHLTYAEIAEITGIHTGSVGKLLSRAIERLAIACRKETPQ